MSLLKSHKANVHCKVDGLAASAGSVLAMCGDTIEAASGSLILIHEPWSFCGGNSKDFRKEADTLDKVRDVIVGLYSAQCRKRGFKDMEKQLAEMMSQETWMDADQAYAVGLVDSVTDALQAAACFDLSKFG